jgi:hypothetical protein
VGSIRSGLESLVSIGASGHQFHEYSSTQSLPLHGSFISSGMFFLSNNNNNDSIEWKIVDVSLISNSKEKASKIT